MPWQSVWQVNSTPESSSMTGQCQYALKEWSVTTDSLLTGRQTLLLRKGGIHEQRDGFKVEHQDFFLFPSHLHQHPQALHPSFRSDLYGPNGSKPRTVVLNTFARVQELIPISNVEVLRGLDGLHTLNWATVLERFSYRNRPGLNLLLLRVYRLPVPHQIQNLARYDGCVSWVELERSLSITAAEPVLIDSVFEEQIRGIRRLIDLASQVTSSARQEHP
jgi:hypothetical protein